MSPPLRIFKLLIIIISTSACVSPKSHISSKSIQGDWTLKTVNKDQENIRLEIRSDSLTWYTENHQPYKNGYELKDKEIIQCHHQKYIGIMCDTIPILSLKNDTLNILLKENGKSFKRTFVKEY